MEFPLPNRREVERIVHEIYNNGHQDGIGRKYKKKLAKITNNDIIIR